ncbi:MAG: pectin acetylesterase-family hydrolase [Pseudomonadales bacterium]
MSETWNAIEPGGDTLCSDGTPYRFFVHPGNTTKLMVYFEGGGACWFRGNCDPSLRPTYKTNLTQQEMSRGNHGVFDFARTDNPLKDYTVVYAPYCTGDVHIGRQDHAYPPEQGQRGDLVIHHRGFTNTDAVLDWTYANIDAPETVFVSGSSAGSIPSPYYALVIGNHYDQARIVQLGDGSGGYRQENGVALPHQPWGTVRELVKNPAYAGLTDDSFNYVELYTRAARARPDIQFAAWDSAEDVTQKQLFALAGLKGVSLLDLFTANQNDIRRAAPDFRSYIAGGDIHTILGRPEFYTYSQGDVMLRDWLADLVNGKPVNDVRCAECAYPELQGMPVPAAVAPLWKEWEGPKQLVEPFWIFDNVAYVGIDWVAAYVVKTTDGLVLIDSLYGKWVPLLEQNLRRLGLNPADVKYVLTTHGHFDHAGGAAYFQQRYGARVVMSEKDWALAAAKAELPYFAFTPPTPDIVARDGDQIVLGDNTFTVLSTPGHTPGAISFRYRAVDGEESHQAITLGGVGLNFSGVEQTQMYIDSYTRLNRETDGIDVSLPNHAAMGGVFERRELLKNRRPGDLHPFVDAAGYRESITRFLAAAYEKLAAEKAGTAEDPLATLTKTLNP